MKFVKKTYQGCSIACTCGESAKFMNWRPASFLSAFGSIRLSRPYYHCRHCKSGFWPLDKALKVIKKSTPAAAQLMSLAGVTEAFEPSAEKLLRKMSGVDVSGGKVRTTSENAGAAAGRMLKEGRLECRERCWDWSVDAHGKTCAYLSMDHVSVRQQLPGGGQTDGRMVAVGMIFNPGPTGKPLQDKRYLAGLYTLVELGRQLRDQAGQVGFDRCEQWIAITDGGNGFEKLINEHFPLAECILDFWHATEHVAELARAICPSEEDFQQQFSQWKEKLSREGGSALLEEWEAMDVSEAAESVQQAHANQTRYFRNNQHRMDYPTYLANGWRIGSGPVESACKTVVGARMKGTGMRWGEDGANEIAHLRALFLSEDTMWEKFWETYPN